MSEAEARIQAMSAGTTLEWRSVGAACIVGVCSLLFSWPFLRSLIWLGDEGVLLHGAQRIIGGEFPYRDFFELLPPGGFALVTLWMSAFGMDFVSVRIFAILTIAFIAMLAFGAGRAVSGKPLLPALLAIFWSLAAAKDWVVVSHHWITTACLMGSVLLVLRQLRDERYMALRVFLAGVLVGAAGMTTTLRGGVAAIVLMLIVSTSSPVPRRGAIDLAMGILVVPVLLGVWLAANGALRQGVEQFVVFAAGNYADIQWVPFGYRAAAYEMVVVLLYPACLVLLLLAVGISRARLLRDPSVRASALLALMAWVTSFPRPDIIHLVFTAPLAFPCIVACSEYLRPRVSRWIAWTCLAVLCVLFPPYVKAWHWLASFIPVLPAVATERGVVHAAFDAGGEELEPLMQTVAGIPVSDGVFFYPYDPMLPYLANRRHVVGIDQMAPGYTSSSQYTHACEEMLARARWVVIDRYWADPARLLRVFPNLKDPSPPAKVALESAIFAAFDIVAETPRRFAVLHRNRAVDSAERLCRPPSAGR